MGRLIYSMITSLDGFVADTDGRFDWSAPDEDVHAAVNDLMRSIGTHLYGRRLYEVMSAWETMDLADEPAVMVDFARLWRAADKVVVSTTLASVSTARTRLVRSFDPVAVATLVRDSADDVLVGGPGLAAAALHAGLVDEIHLFVSPVIVGGGTPALPAGLRRPLTRRGTRTFDNGVVHLTYGRPLPSGDVGDAGGSGGGVAAAGGGRADGTLRAPARGAGRSGDHPRGL